ncbi:Arc family DNA-binding protein [Cellulomonas sp. NPDC089187]|uniref:FitA-like ribbon-helix-helix domain-containing protein n=1 Tax=Cellulomonas sp. NPDC089187 TaxID=3154970 RepID=UPI00342AB13F
MEQLLIRNLPGGTKAKLKDLARRHDRSMEAEARAIVERALEQDRVTMVDLLAMDGGESIEFEPGRLGLTGRPVDL